MMFRSGARMAIAALHLLSLTTHVFALDLDLGSQGKRLRHRDLYFPVLYGLNG